MKDGEFTRMAKESGANESGKQDQGTDSRPISVAELLARTQAADEAEAARTSRSDRGRRRAGRAGAVSVSELTGEIPRVDGPAAFDTPAARPAQPSEPDTDRTPATPSTPAASTPAASTPASAEAAPASDAATSASPETQPWRSPAESGQFPRSANPLAHRGTPERPEPDAASARVPSTGRSASGMPTFAPPGTRDFSADAVSRRLAPNSGAARPEQTGGPASDESVTGIIPVIDGPDADAPESAAKSNFSEVIDDDFEAYRSFADVHGDDKAAAPAKKKRRWFSRKDKKATAVAEPSRASAAKAAAESEPTADATAEQTDSPATHDDAEPKTAPARTDGAFAARPDDVAADAVTGIIPVVDGPDLNDEVVVADSDDVEAAELDSWSATSAEARTDDADTVAASAIARDSRDSDDAGAADSGWGNRATAASDADAADDHDDRGAALPATAAMSAAGIAGAAAKKSAGSDHPDSDHGTADGESAESEKDAESSSKANRHKTKEAAKAAKKKAKDSGKRSSEERSPAMAWLVLIGEILAGLVVGAALFWGFKELWQWSPYFALVLAVLVTFGIVTFSHLVRKSNDLITTLLALAVGLIVTIGPLVFLAS